MTAKSYESQAMILIRVYGYGLFIYYAEHLFMLIYYFGILIRTVILLRCVISVVITTRRV